MVVATGYFAKAIPYSESGYALVSIAKVLPWFLDRKLRVYSCSRLAPSAEIMSLKDSPSEYARRYNSEILSKIDPNDIVAYLGRIARQESTDKVAILCYERPEKFCHRHLVAKWLSDKLGQKVEEVDMSKKPKQRSLFGEEESSST